VTASRRPSSTTSRHAPLHSNSTHPEHRRHRPDRTSHCYAVATRADFLVRGVVRCRRAFRGLKISSEEIGRNEHPHSARFFSDEFFCPSAKDVHQNLGRRTRTSCVQEARTTPRTRKTVRAATTLGGIAKSNRTDDVTAALSVCLSTGTSVTVVHLLKPLDCIKCHLAEH